MLTNDDRTPHFHIRITTGVREAQLADLAKLDALCAAEVPARDRADFANLARHNTIHVAELGQAVAGFLVWRVESPGVAYLVDVQVPPDYQPFGIAAALLDALREDARKLWLDQIVVRVWEKASSTMAFYRGQRFMPIDATAPAEVQGWKEARLATGQPLTRPGELALWSPIWCVPMLIADDETDRTLLTGEGRIAPTTG